MYHPKDIGFGPRTWAQTRTHVRLESRGSSRNLHWSGLFIPLIPTCSLFYFGAYNTTGFGRLHAGAFRHVQEDHEFGGGATTTLNVTLNYGRKDWPVRTRSCSMSIAVFTFPSNYQRF